MELPKGGDFMKEYDANVRVVMDFLESQGFSKSAVSIHRVCYNTFRKYLKENKFEYSYESGVKWQNQNELLWPKWRIKCNRICIKQLDDVYKKGVPDRYHPYQYPTNVSQLEKNFKAELYEYLNSDCFKTKNDTYLYDAKMKCSDFLLHLQNQGKKSVREISYDDVINYCLKKTSRSTKTFDRYISQVRKFLKYYAVKGHIRKGFSIAINRLLIPQFIRYESISNQDRDKINILKSRTPAFSSEEMWDVVNEFLIVLERNNYSITVKRCSKHFLSLLFIFLDMYDIGYTSEIAWIWFENVKPLLLSGWKMHRRNLRQFEEYIQNGKISPEKIFKYKLSRFECLPNWCRSTLGEFLEQKKRENMQPSTICMYQSTNVRFCEYLVKSGIKSFEEISVDTLMQFYFEDYHTTLEGKNAYNVRIRKFIIYLTEKGIIKNAFLHLGLPCKFAQGERIVRVLNEDEKKAIFFYIQKAVDGYELRGAAMVMLGLTMGMRASDIVNLQFANIDWKHHAIRFIQKKTLKEELLPMPVAVGNCIFRYIKKGRPKSTSPYIFIHHRVPYGKMDPIACQSALKKALPNRNVAGCGFHVTRKTFATSLLNKGVKPNTIIDSLGHSSDCTVHKYLSLDENRMRLCPLSLSETNISLRGGLL